MNQHLYEGQAVTKPVYSENSIQFSLVAGGPFHSLLGRFGLLGPDRLPAWQTAVVLALLAWAPPAICRELDGRESLIFSLSD